MTCSATCGFAPAHPVSSAESRIACACGSASTSATSEAPLSTTISAPRREKPHARQVVRGLHGVLAKKHLELGARAGYPVGEPTKQLGGLVAFVDLDNDMRIYWTMLSGAWSVRGAIRARYESFFAKSWLGMPISDEACDPGGTTCASRFQWGSIYFSNGAARPAIWVGVHNDEISVGLGTRASPMS